MQKTLLTSAILIFILFNSFAQSTNRGLVAEYNFNNNSNDDTQNGNNAILNGSLTYGEDRKGNKCSALVFDGNSSSYVRIKEGSSFDNLFEQFTISVWAKMDSNSPTNWFSICCKSDKVGEEVEGSPSFRFQFSKITLSLSTIFTTSDLNINFQKGKWYFFAVTYNGQKVSFYQDGKLIKEYDYNGGFISNNEDIIVGKDVPGEVETFMGAMDELRFYEDPLSATEIEAIYKDNSCLTKNAVPCGNSPVADPILTKNNLVLLLDKSGSMKEEIILLQDAFIFLLDLLKIEDEISIVTFDSKASIVLSPTSCSKKKLITDKLGSIAAGGSTNFEQGLEKACDIASQNFKNGYNNRIIIATDGAFSLTSDMEDKITKTSNNNVFISVFNFSQDTTKRFVPLKKIATLGKGDYIQITDENQLKNQLYKQMNK